MDPQFHELAREIVDAVERRLSGTLEERLKTHIDQFEQRAETRLKTHIDHLDQRVKTHIDQFEERAELRMQMHFENLGSVFTLAAEGYGATLQRIERRLTELESNSL